MLDKIRISRFKIKCAVVCKCGNEWFANMRLYYEDGGGFNRGFSLPFTYTCKNSYDVTGQFIYK